MKLRLLIGLVLLAALAIAVAGWTVDGVRWLLGGWWDTRAEVAPA